MRSNITTRASWPARTSLAVCETLGLERRERRRRLDTNRKKNTDSRKDQVRGRECLSNALNGNVKGSCLGTYQANSISDGIREGRQNIDRRLEPFGQALIASLRLIKLLDLLSKNSLNAARRIALLELCSEWMAQKVFLCPFSIRF